MTCECPPDGYQPVKVIAADGPQHPGAKAVSADGADIGFMAAVNAHNRKKVAEADPQHSPVFTTIKALEDAGLDVSVAYHLKSPNDHKQGTLVMRVAEAFHRGAEWVSVIVVSAPPSTKDKLCP